MDWGQHSFGCCKWSFGPAAPCYFERQQAYAWSCRLASLIFAGIGQLLRTRLVLLNEEDAAVLLYQSVPKLYYFVSAAAFFSAFVQNCCALLYESGSTKKQLALVSCFIKGISAYVDLLLASGSGVIILDSSGQP